MQYIAAVGDMKVGCNGDEIITYSLGSCLGLVVHDPKAQVGDILHAMLPLSKTNREKAERKGIAFIHKPFTLEIIRDTINDLTGIV